MVSISPLQMTSAEHVSVGSEVPTRNNYATNNYWDDFFLPEIFVECLDWSTRVRLNVKGNFDSLFMRSVHQGRQQRVHWGESVWI